MDEKEQVEIDRQKNTSREKETKERSPEDINLQPKCTQPMASLEGR